MNRRACLAALAATAVGTPARAADAGPRVPEVTLLDHTATPHALRALCAGPVVIGFFFTGCASVCPLQTASLRTLRQTLDAPAGRAAAGPRSPMLLSISVDPLGDSPAALREHARRFDVRLGLHAGWLMLTGAPADLAPVWRAFEVPVGDPQAHPSMLWLGDAGTGRWTRAPATTPPQRLLALLREQAA